MECLPPTPPPPQSLLWLLSKRAGRKIINRKRKSMDSSLTSMGSTEVIRCRSLRLPQEISDWRLFYWDLHDFCLIQSDRNSLYIHARRLLHGAARWRVPYIKNMWHVRRLSRIPNSISELWGYWCTLFHCDFHSKPYLNSDRRIGTFCSICIFLEHFALNISRWQSPNWR
jgi:hypothetical protein